VNIRQQLEQQAALYRRLGAGGFMETFVLRNGKRRRGDLYKGVRGKPKDCFCTAATYVLQRNVGRYVEGYAVRPGLGLLIHHAWVEVGGVVIDPTWDRPEEAEYLGVSFTPKELRRELFLNKYYGVFCPDGIRFNTRMMLERDPKLVELFPSLEEYHAAR